jgi:Novel STAND NTPase 1
MVPEKSVEIKTLDEALEAADRFLEQYDVALDKGEKTDAVVSGMAIELRDWIARSVAIGTRIGSAGERQKLQGQINYWSSLLSRHGEWSGSGMLAAYDENEGEDLPDEACPYPGLRPCREGDVFVGREEYVSDYCTHINDKRLLVIVAGSGAGKSSIVIAGMFPRLKKELLPEASGWVYLRRAITRADRTVPPSDAFSEEPPGITPGTRPLRALVQSMANATNMWADNKWMSSSYERLLLAPAEVTGWLDEIVPRLRVFLFVDQFEELLSLCSDTREQTAFQALLLSMVTSASREDRVVLTMRTDHLSVFERRFPQFYGLMTENIRTPKPMEFKDLKRVIEIPAKSMKPVHLKFSPPDLVDEIARETDRLTGALPLLQFALKKLWSHRNRDKITRESYRQLPDVQRSLATTADKLYDDLGDAEKAGCRQMMLELAVIVRFEEPLRRRLREAELVERLRKENPTADPENIIGPFCDNGLLVRTGSGEEAQIEVAHETLFRNWDKFLEKWLPAEKEDMLLRQRTESDAQEWWIAQQQAEAAGESDNPARNPSDLLSLKGERLRDARRLCSKGRLAAQAEAFVKACEALEEEQKKREREAEEAKKAADESENRALRAIAQEAKAKQRQAEANRKQVEAEKLRAEAETQKQRAKLVSGFSMFVAVAVVLVTYLVWRQHSLKDETEGAQKEANIFRMTKLAQEAFSNAEPLTALDIALTFSETITGFGGPDRAEKARPMLAKALDTTDFYQIFERRDVGGFFSTGGRYFVQLETNNKPIWAVHSLEGKKPISLGPDLQSKLKELLASDVSPDGSYAVLLWRLTQTGSESAAPMSLWICSLDWAKSGPLECPDQAKHRLKGSVLVATAIARSGNAFGVATLENSMDTGGTAAVEVFTREGGTVFHPSVLSQEAGTISAIAFLDESGKQLLLGDSKGAVRLSKRKLKSTHKATVMRIIVSPDGKSFLTYGKDSQLLLWPTQDSAPLLLSSGDLTSASFAARGDRLVAVVDQMVHCWTRISDTNTWKEFQCDDHSPAFQAAFDPDADYLWVARDKTIGALTRVAASGVSDLGEWTTAGGTALTWSSRSVADFCPVLYSVNLSATRVYTEKGASHIPLNPKGIPIPGICKMRGPNEAVGRDKPPEVAAATRIGKASTFSKDITTPARSEGIVNASPSLDGNWIAFATSPIGADPVEAQKGDQQSVYVKEVNPDKKPELVFKLPIYTSRTSVEKLAVFGKQTGAHETPPMLGAAVDNKLYIFARTAEEWEAALNPQPYELPPRLRDKARNKISCMAFSPEGGQLIIGTEIGEIFRAQRAENKWTITPWASNKSADENAFVVKESISACAIDEGGNVALGTGGDVFRFQGIARPEKLTQILHRFDAGVASVSLGSDGRVAALSQRPPNSREFFGARQRLVVWKFVKDNSEVVLDLSLPAPIFAVSLTDSGVSYLTGRGMIVRPCHACEPLKNLLETARARNAKPLSQVELAQLLGEK